MGIIDDYFKGQILQAKIAIAYYLGGWQGAAAVVASSYAQDQAKKAQQRARDQFNEGLQDRYQMVKSAVVLRSTLYGRARVSGPLLLAHTTGDLKQFLHLIVAVGGHEFDAIETVLLNNVELPTPDPTTGYITSGDYAPGLSVTIDTDFALAGWPAVAQVLTLTIGTGDTLAQIVSVSYIYNRLDGPTLDSAAPVLSYSAVGPVITVASQAPTAARGLRVTYQVQRLTSTVRVRTVLGTDTQAAFAEAVAETGGKWTANHRGLGIPMVYLRLEYSQDVFGQIGLPNVSVVARGKKVRDPRTGTTAWSQNPALCAADYLRDQVLGLRATAPQVPDAEIIEAADICDELIDIDGAGTMQKRYSCDTLLSSESGPRANLATVTKAMAGTVVWVQGRWLVRAGAHRAATFTITESMLAGGGCVIQPYASLRDSVNRVIPSYAEPVHGYTEMQAPAVENALYLAEDGGIDMPLEVTYEACTDAIQAQRLAKIELERSRQAMVVQVSCNLLAYDVAPTDVVALTISRYGWSSKLFEVQSRRLDLQQGTVELVLRETAAGVWDWAHGDATAVDLTPNTDLPDPHLKPAALSALTVASGEDHLQIASDGTIITRALVTWSPSTDIFVAQGGRIVVQWREAAATEWQDVAAVPGDSVQTYIPQLRDGSALIVRVKPVNSAGRSGDWSVIAHTVIGKTAPPPDPLTFAAAEQPGGLRSYYWTINPPLDLSGFLLRYSEGTTARPWGAMVPLLEAGKDERSRISNLPADGEHWLAIKAKDTTGNESANARFLQVLFDASGFGVAFLSVDPTALGWPGTRTSCDIDGYFLSDIGTGTWSSLPLTWDAWATWVEGSTGSITYEHTVIDAGSSAVTRIRTSDVGSGTVVTEYASSTDGVSYTGWATIPAGAVTAQYFKVRWTVTGSLPILYRAAATLYR